ncbi:hypothetical protein K1719_040731 [Acacia pycnantha]|nr:hypothetical protein K1719_040731 [Acacia pycnantha]
MGVEAGIEGIEVGKRKQKCDVSEEKEERIEMRDDLKRTRKLKLCNRSLLAASEQSELGNEQPSLGLGL